MSEPNNRRSNEQVREVVANILLMDVSDPRLRMVTITGADVSPDKRNAKIYYTANKDHYDEIEESFNSAKGYIRKLLGDRLQWRVVPAINFYLDPSVDMGETIAAAFDRENKR